MIREAIATGATIEAAREAAISQLNAPQSAEVQIEVLELAVKKTLGLFGGSPAKVKAYYKESPSLIAIEYLNKILKEMNVTGLSLKTEETPEGLDIVIECDDYGMIIGHRGDTLDALQYLTGLVANRSGENYYRITINTANYREKRESSLISLAKRTAIQVSRNGRSVTLEPMNPYERRIIHTAVQQIRGAKSHSIGEDINRCVVISSDENFKRPYKPREGSGKPYSKESGYKGSNPRPRGNFNRAPGNYDSKPKDNYNKPRTNQQTPSPDRPPHKEYAGAQLYGRVDKPKDDSKI